MGTRVVHTQEMSFKSGVRVFKSPIDFTLLVENLIRAYPCEAHFVWCLGAIGFGSHFQYWVYGKGVERSVGKTNQPDKI